MCSNVLEKYHISAKQNNKLIRFLSHIEIDKLKWDNVIETSQYPVFYALSWYLDFVSPEWCALVEDDYVMVMPLPIKKKLGISLITQPIMSQQLGVFSKLEIQQSDLIRFLRAIPIRYPLVRLSMNVSNPSNACRDVSIKQNFVLPLSNSYIELQQNFSANTIRNVKKAKRSEIKVKPCVSIKDAFNLFAQSNSFYNEIKYKTVLEFLVKRNCCEIVGAFGNDELLAVSFFVKDNNRYVYIASTVNVQGRKMRAQYAIINYFIESHSQEKALLDFEGSSIPSIAKFFKGFGAQKQEYFAIRMFYPFLKLS